ncbi:MAG: DUF3108 domain-containing protein, partial [Gemmatimonadales bacterium]
MRTAAVFVLVSLSVAAPLAAQHGTTPGGKSAEVKLAEVPFGVGERLSYSVKFGPLEVGEAEMAVVGIDSIGGHPTYHLRYSIKGGTFFYKLEDVQESWFDVFSLVSRRFVQDIHEGDYVRYRVFDFDLEERVYRQDNGETDSIPAQVLDDASFVYFVRSVPLEVGKTYEWNRYFRWDR